MKIIKNILARLKKSKTATQNSFKEKCFTSKLSNNAYLQSKVLWNDMYGDVETKLVQSQRLNLILSGIVGLAMIGFVVVAGETKVTPVPFIIHGNEIITTTKTTDTNTLKPQLALYFAKTFLRHARSVSRDRMVNQTYQMTAFSFVNGNATQVLKEFYNQNDPDKISSRLTRSIAIQSILRLSPQTLEIRWQETSRATGSGEVLKQKHYLARITYRYSKPSQNTVILKANPMGFNITQLAWSEDLN